MVEMRWYEIMLRIIKILLYGFLCLTILGGSVITKGAALLATSQLREQSVPLCEYYPGNLEFLIKKKNGIEYLQKSH